MDQVLAKIKRVRKNPYRKLLSDVTLFEAIDLTKISKVAYNSDHNLDEDSWFAVESFSEKEFFPETLQNAIDSKDYDALTKDKFQDITYLLSAQGEDAYFQKVTPASFIKRKLLAFGEVVELHEGVDRILIKSFPDAVFLRVQDTLLFRDIASVSSIFPGIDQLYKEATMAEVVEFLSLEFISVSGGYNHEAVSKPNRRRLALVSETMKKMPEDQRSSLIEYICAYCKDGVTLTADGKSFDLSTDTQLKLILYGIEERFYTTQHSKEKRLANSVETLAG